MIFGPSVLKRLTQESNLFFSVSKSFGATLNAFKVGMFCLKGCSVTILFFAILPKKKSIKFPFYCICILQNSQAWRLKVCQHLGNIHFTPQGFCIGT
jgi:hypothetical protein